MIAKLLSFFFGNSSVAKLFTQKKTMISNILILTLQPDLPLPNIFWAISGLQWRLYFKICKLDKMKPLKSSCILLLSWFYFRLFYQRWPQSTRTHGLPIAMLSVKHGRNCHWSTGKSDAGAPSWLYCRAPMFHETPKCWDGKKLRFPNQKNVGTRSLCCLLLRRGACADKIHIRILYLKYTNHSLKLPLAPQKKVGGILSFLVSSFQQALVFESSCPLRHLGTEGGARCSC